MDYVHPLELEVVQRSQDLVHSVINMKLPLDVANWRVCFTPDVEDAAEDIAVFSWTISVYFCEENFSLKEVDSRMGPFGI